MFCRSPLQSITVNHYLDYITLITAQSLAQGNNGDLWCDPDLLLTSTSTIPRLSSNRQTEMFQGLYITICLSLKLCSLEQSRLKVKSADSDIILGKTKSTWLHFDDKKSYS